MLLRKRKYVKRGSARPLAYMTTIIEYLFAEVLELVVNAAQYKEDICK